MDSVKCVVTGDVSVGKTCLLVSYATNTFPQEYVPPIFQNYTKNILVGGRPLKLSLWDTPGNSDLDRLRPLSYTKADIIIVCFAVDNVESLQSLESKWIPEARQFAPNTPVLVVGTKSDLRDERDNNALVDSKEAKIFAEKLGSIGYEECSARELVGISKVFDVAVRNALGRKAQPGTCCIIL